MLDQFFSVKSLKKIFDYENRRGFYFKSIVTSDINNITKEIKQVIKDIKDYKSKGSLVKKTGSETILQELYKKKNDLIKQKNDLIKIELQKISDKILSDNFMITLTKNDFNQSKPVYTIDKKSPEVFFAIKQIQNILKKTYKVKQSNRNQILSQFKYVIKSTYPKYIIRTDIKSFYESIDQDRLLEKIDEDKLLTLDIKKIIHQICEAYKYLSGNDKGIPRGIGLSPFLAEIYMKDVDSLMKNNKNIIFYARYVDDIIIVATSRNIEKLLEKEIFKLGLELNKENNKTKKIYINTENKKLKNKKYEVKYLGYKMCIKNDDIVFELSEERINKYKKRILQTFEEYNWKKNFNEKQARKECINRLQFLAYNTKLYNNKSNILIGSYFSNSLLTSEIHLQELDAFLTKEIEKYNLIDKLKERIKKISFQQGFKNKIYVNFNIQDLKKINSIWMDK